MSDLKVIVKWCIFIFNNVWVKEYVFLKFVLEGWLESFGIKIIYVLILSKYFLIVFNVGYV